jgi:glycosyltransferase involved in cell wall biosynthesis
LTAIASLPNVTFSFHERKIDLPDLPDNIYKILIIQRSLPDSDQNWQKTLEEIHKRGWCVIAEWDDHPDLFAPLIRENFDKAPWASVKHVDGVQTSTPKLKSIITEIRKNKKGYTTEYFENNLIEIPIQLPKNSKFIRIFIGALNREKESGLILEPLNKILKDFEEAQVVILHDKNLFDQIQSDRKEFYPAVNYDRYLAIMQSCHILLAPLDESLGNSCKSDLKFIEASGYGLVTIASPTVYESTISDSVNGFIAHNQDEFEAHLNFLFENPEKIKSIGDAAYEYVKNNRLQSHLTLKKLTFYKKVYTTTFP